MLNGELVAVEALARRDRDAMYLVLARHFGATRRDRFESDLAAKQWVLLLRDSQRLIQGFSTVQIYPIEHQGVACRVIYSGDTVIDRSFWGEQELAFNWLRLAGSIYAEYPAERLFWFLISKGHRTFRYLPAFAKQFYPHWKRSTPEFEAGLLQRLAVRHFGAHYLPELGVVSFAQSLGHLHDEFAEVSQRELRLDAVRFFLERNPGYRRGDELCCLCELSPDNLKPLAQRLFSKGYQPMLQEDLACQI